VMVHGQVSAAPPPPAADEETAATRAAHLQDRLNERIDYELLVQTTLDKALDEMLVHQGKLSWRINERAFAKAGLAKDYVRKAEIDKIDKLTGATRTEIVERLLAIAEPAANKPDANKNKPDTIKVELAYVIRPDGLEITTRKAYLEEFFPDRDDDSPLPPLTYAVFDDVPLKDALAKLADGAESNIVLDARLAADAKAKVTANLTAVPLDAAVQLLADMADLKVVHVANVYYVTSPKHARLLQKEEDKRRLEGEKGKAGPMKPPVAP